MTPIYGITSDGVKRTARDLRVLPKAVVYDAALTVSLPAAATGPSGMNAIAHCVEALYAQDQNPISSLIAEEGSAALARGILVPSPTPMTSTCGPRRSTARSLPDRRSRPWAWRCTIGSVTSSAGRSD